MFLVVSERSGANQFNSSYSIPINVISSCILNILQLLL